MWSLQALISFAEMGYLNMGEGRQFDGLNVGVGMTF